MHSIVIEDNRNARRYWMYTLIITTYSMNKRGFHCALLRLSFRWFCSSPTSIPVFFASILSSLLPHFFVKPLQVSNSLSFAYLFLTSVSCTRLHNEDQLRTAPRKRTVYFTWLVNFNDVFYCLSSSCASGYVFLLLHNRNSRYRITNTEPNYFF